MSLFTDGEILFTDGEYLFSVRELKSLYLVLFYTHYG